MSFVSKTTTPFTEDNSSGAFVSDQSGSFTSVRTTRVTTSVINGWGTQAWGTSTWGLGISSTVVVQLGDFVEDNSTPFVESL
jgi:hypothetical protein